MKLKTKKIIAREFLLLLLCAALAIFTFLGIYPYNFLKKRQIEALTIEITDKKNHADSLLAHVERKASKQFKFTNWYAHTFNVPREHQKIWMHFYKMAQTDSIKQLCEPNSNRDFVAFLNQTGFKSPERFKSFILKNTLTLKDIHAKEASIIANKEADSMAIQRDELTTQILPFKSQLGISYLVFLTGLVALFLLRYVYYGIKWSILVLKQKSI
ncbi:hypothetical protein L3C95_18085 [Chitinophaga filiformis]|uniref:hypothetical protein n=1 Tax=Chitinophaga filiformis TaxID=104663 RepID=UPI001F32AC51|nr:hypothetical protein [Chitinophaga filiformis]MCF6404814.1 hypothetical protein [Chitinophaga filiformis]